MWNQTVKKVDVVGKKIPNFQKWRKTHSNDVYFDSLLEFHCNQCLDASGVDFTYHPDSQIFLNSYEVDDFIPQYIAKKNVKSKNIKKGDIIKAEIKTIIIRQATYGADFIILHNGKEYFVESKGFARPDFILRFKLFRAQLKRVNMLSW